MPSRLPASIFGNLPLERLGEVYRWDLQPDIAVIDHEKQHVTILEIGVANRKRISELITSKPAHYNRLRDEIFSGGRYTCSLYGIIMGNLGEIPMNAIQTLAKVANQTTHSMQSQFKHISKRIVQDALAILSLNMKLTQA